MDNDRTSVEAPVMPTSVMGLRVLLYVMAGLNVLLFAALAMVGFSAGETGAVVGVPLLLGIVGMLLAVRIGPGTRRVRTGIIVLEAVWTLISLGGIGQSDPTGIVMLIFSIAVLVLANTRGARGYFGSGE